MTVVTLTPNEYMDAAIAGARICATKVIRGTPEKGLGPPDNTVYTCSIEGVAGEMAVSKYLNVWYNPEVGKTGSPDGPYEVRQTAYKSGCLLIQKKDRDDSIFILVVGERMHYRLAGWVKGIEGKADEWWDTEMRYPVYKVPQDYLRPMALLPAYSPAA